MAQSPVYRFDDFLADPETWRLTRSGQEIHVEPVVLRLLIYLITHRGRLVSRQELMDTVWGETVISDAALTKAVGRLRQALGDESGAPRYLETVHSQGYRFIAAVEETEQPDLSTDTTRGTAAHRGLLAVVAAIAVLALVGTFWSSSQQQGSSPADDIRSLAVLPLSNLTGDPEQDYYVDGIQDILITELSRIPELRVTSRQSTRRYRGSQLTMNEIAGELGVDALVEGSLLRTGDTIEVSVQLIHARSDAHLWAERYVRETPNVFDLISEIVNAIGAELGASAASPGHGVSAHEVISPIDPRAIEAYAIGITHLDGLTGDGIRTAIDQFEMAVAIEPEFALAWGELGVAHTMQGMFGFALPKESKEQLRRVARNAIEADDQVAIGHSALGWLRWYTWVFDGACESFEEALRLNPSAPYAIHGVADCLLFDGRMDESVARLRDVLTISPFSAAHNLPLPSHLYMARRFDEAIDASRAMQLRTPQLSVHFFLALVYWEQGRFDKALEEERLEFERRGDTVLLAALEEGFAEAGPTGAMRAKARAQAARAKESYVDPYDVGETFARAGMVDEALHWLDQAVEHGSYKMTYIAYWPHLDAVRGDPRFQDLLERVYGRKQPLTDL